MEMAKSANKQKEGGFQGGSLFFFSILRISVQILIEKNIFKHFFLSVKGMYNSTVMYTEKNTFPMCYSLKHFAMD